MTDGCRWVLRAAPLALLAMAAAQACRGPRSGPATGDEVAPGCASGMAAVPGLPACIDRWEATIESGRAVARPGALPASAASWREVDAACRAAGKRLCTVEEWERACRGAEDRDFAYGARFDPTRCNGAARQPDAVRASVVPTGSLRDCATPEGVFDLSGNVWEWTAGGDPTGGLYELRGGGFGNQEDLLGCRPEDSLLQPADEGHSGYGFRCCANR